MYTQPDYYDNQSGVIPFRFGEDGLEVLLITSRRSGRWIVPKGVVEPDLTPVESAQNEAWEEAGVEGVVREAPLGSYGSEKRGNFVQVVIYAMKVETVHEVWQEDDRAREWVDVQTAAGRVQEEELQTMILSLPAIANEKF